MLSPEEWNGEVLEREEKNVKQNFKKLQQEEETRSLKKEKRGWGAMLTRCHLPFFTLEKERNYFIIFWNYLSWREKGADFPSLHESPTPAFFTVYFQSALWAGTCLLCLGCFKSWMSPKKTFILITEKRRICSPGFVGEPIIPAFYLLLAFFSRKEMPCSLKSKP